MKRSLLCRVRKQARTDRLQRSRSRSRIEILESRCYLSAEIMDPSSALMFAASSLEAPQLVHAYCQASTSQDVSSDSFRQQYIDVVDLLHCDATDFEPTDAMTDLPQLPSLPSPQTDASLPASIQPADIPPIENPSLDGSSDDGSANVTQPLTNEQLRESTASEFIGKGLQAGEDQPGGDQGGGDQGVGDNVPTPQISPVPPIVMTISFSVTPQAIGTKVANPLRDISEFLTSSYPRREAEFDHFISVRSAGEKLGGTNQRFLAPRLHSQSPVDVLSPIVERHSAVSVHLQSKLRMASVTVLMPVQAPRPPRSADQSVSADAIHETIPILKEDDSNSTESVKAEIPGKSEKQLGRRASTLLGIMIASLVGMPHAFRQRLIRQPNRVTTLRSLDHYT